MMKAETNGRNEWHPKESAVNEWRTSGVRTYDKSWTKVGTSIQ